MIEKDSHHTYILPRPNGEIVLGGTTQRDDWRTTSSEDDVKDIMERCKKILPAVADSKVLNVQAGLRPQTATGTRVAVDPKRTATGALLIHNYGHGGSGHTLHWGCAQDVVGFAKMYSARSRL